MLQSNNRINSIPIEITLKTIQIEFLEQSIRFGTIDLFEPLGEIPLNPSIYQLTNPTYLLQELLQLFQIIFTQYLYYKPKLCKIIIIEQLTWTSLFRDCLLTTLISVYQVYSITFQPSLYLSCLTTGIHHGLIIQCNSNNCQLIAYSDYRPMLSTWKILNAGLFSYLHKEALDTQDIDIHQMDQSLFQDSLLFGQYSSSQNNNETIIFDENGLIDLILQIIEQSPIDLRIPLMKNIYLIGCHGPLLEVLSQGIQNQLSNIQSFHSKTTMSIVNLTCQLQTLPFPCHMIPWIGGCLFAANSSNQTKYLFRDSSREPHQSQSHQQPLQQQCSRAYIHPNLTTKSLGLTNDFLLLHCPDWLSLDEKDWIFYGPKL